MSDRAALIAAVLDNWADDTSRLIFADYLQENGEVDRAEFIRLDCALEVKKAAWDKSWTPDQPLGNGWDPDGPLERQMLSLVSRMRDCREPLGLRALEGQIERGLYRDVSFTVGDFATRAAQLLEREPVLLILTLSASPDREDDTSFDLIEKLAANPHLKAVTRIHSDGAWPAWWLTRLMRSPHLGNLVELNLVASFFRHRSVQLGLAEVRAIVESPSPFALSVLDLDGTLEDLGTEEAEGAVELIASSPRLGTLKRLGLSNNRLGRRSVESLLASTTLPRKLHLTIQDNAFDEAEIADRLAERFGAGSDGGEED